MGHGPPARVPRQYDAFAERRLLAAEAEARYVENLRNSDKMLETRRVKPPAKKKKQTKSSRKDDKRGPGKRGKS